MLFLFAFFFTRTAAEIGKRSTAVHFIALDYQTNHYELYEFLQTSRKLCGEIMRDERRVSAYIDEMTCTPFGPSLVAGWNNDLKKLKHYRHIRNLIAHEPDCSEDSLCVPSDAVWIENFCTRILNLSDPLSLYRRALAEQRKAQAKRIPQPQDLDFENAVRTNENFNKSSANKNNGNKAAKHAAAAVLPAVFTVAAILILMLILFLFLLTAK